MWRVVLRPALLFLLPFLLYAAWLLLRQTTPWARANWSQTVVSTLTLLGLAFGILADRHLGAYVPAHIENGVVVPGHIQ